jgi:hypothetical protein
MVCLTFDDDLPCHYKTVITELNRRGMKRIHLEAVPWNRSCFAGLGY